MLAVQATSSASAGDSWMANVDRFIRERISALNSPSRSAKTSDPRRTANASSGRPAAFNAQPQVGSSSATTPRSPSCSAIGRVASVTSSAAAGSPLISWARATSAVNRIPSGSSSAYRPSDARIDSDSRRASERPTASEQGAGESVPRPCLQPLVATLAAQLHELTGEAGRLLDLSSRAERDRARLVQLGSSGLVLGERDGVPEVAGAAGVGADRDRAGRRRFERRPGLGGERRSGPHRRAHCSTRPGSGRR